MQDVLDLNSLLPASYTAPDVSSAFGDPDAWCMPWGTINCNGGSTQ